jgi:hypothetical protein
LSPFLRSSGVETLVILKYNEGKNDFVRNFLVIRSVIPYLEKDLVIIDSNSVKFKPAALSMAPIIG